MIEIFPEFGPSQRVIPVIFPDGTSQITIPNYQKLNSDTLLIKWTFENEREIIDLAQLRTGLSKLYIILELPYLPFARQDKAVTFKRFSTFGLTTFSAMINSMGFQEIIIREPHNVELTKQLFLNCTIQTEPFSLLKGKNTNGSLDEPPPYLTVVYPDEGAWLRYHGNEELKDLPTLQFTKKRDPSTGIITDVSSDFAKWQASRMEGKYIFIIIDDLVDGGRTFTQCAEWIRKHFPWKNADIEIHLEVIHGVLSQGLPIEGIDSVYCHHHILHPCMHNPLIHTDGYKLSHMEMYPPKTEFIYSYMVARSGKKYDRVTFFGLQYYLLKYLQGRVTTEMVEEFYKIRKLLLGDVPAEIKRQMESLIELKYLPLEIKAVPEGTSVDVGNVLVTVKNTLPGYFWLVGLVESLLLKVWYTSSVATFSRSLRKVCEDYSTITCDTSEHIDYQIHDFGYRGASSEETAAVGGMAHLVSFDGTDTIPSTLCVREHYGIPYGQSVGSTIAGTEHSVMCSYGKDAEYTAFERMFDIYPSGNVSIVSDTYDYWKVLTEYLPRLKDRILARDGKIIIRPDSGNPELILLGDPNAEFETPQHLGTLRWLDRVFGSTVNNKGFKLLCQSIGIIYGDGMYSERIKRIMQGCLEQGYATSNLNFGVGGILLQNHSRDDLGFAFKASSVTIDGVTSPIFKDPITDHSKKSHHGLLTLQVDADGHYRTKSEVSVTEEQKGLLRTVFKDGTVMKHDSFIDIRTRSRN